MISLLFKEINSFLNSLIGYIVLIVFLSVISLFLWVFPGAFNVFESGFASIDSLFIITPWVYMFLIPAITMRLFAEERKAGTLELLLTKPLTEMQVVLAKYFAGVLLVIISLLPTLLYYLCIRELSFPVGNVDSGAVWGSYLGLILLGAAFTSIGLFASSLTDNQVVAFVIALFFCLLAYTGIETISAYAGWGKTGLVINRLGISSHYESIGRGVVDTRDVIYFLSFITFFILLTRLKLESRKW
ncbi:MAG: gliding motility-associated ABC transporter permease subunit GldF [Bacteroidia bacterium]|nr:gliding motility-associated ABC transporter permease subunit GldF [Bacteroidia bacterium]MCZ2277428.1 gliding motility-associated ABC transporter permease subunit GldF [Bacteroidia bacterium]